MSNGNQGKKPAKAVSKLSFLVLLFDPEDGANIFFRNFGLSPNYTVLQGRTPSSSYLPP
jgi:hypothetical protein